MSELTNEQGSGAGSSDHAPGNDNQPVEKSPFTVSDAGTVSVTRTGVVTAGSADDAVPGSTSIGSGEVSKPAADLAPVDVSQLARGPISDEDFESLVLRLRSDPTLLKQLIDEFRQEQGADRLALLARLLGEAGGPEVTLAASELIYSGNDAARELGLDLLQLVQPGNAEARDIVSGMLATEVEPQILKNTLTTLARPGAVDDNSRAFLADQVALLASHEDAGVRGISLDILSRWSTDGRDTPVLLNGLRDAAPRVRESAAYALVGHEEKSQAVLDALWSVALDADEVKSTRRAAILALRSMPLTEAQSNDLTAVERRLDTVVRGQ
jgi:hypothetical protein